MIIENTIIEETLKMLLQKQVKMYIKNKCFKTGRLLLFKQNNYHLEITIRRPDNEIKKFEIPIPFDIEVWETDNLVYFDYRLTTLARGKKELEDLLSTLDRDGNNKFYNRILEIEIIPEEE